MKEEKSIKKILEFWFGDLKENGIPDEKKQKIWWAKDEKTDKYIKNRFENHLIQAKNEELESWRITPRGLLAFIILTDQFSRNIYRGNPLAFSQDEMALQGTLEGINKGMDTKLYAVERVFFHMPLMHSEDIEIQSKSINYFSRMEKDYLDKPDIYILLKGNKKYAEKHYEIIKRFGRFPHRNKVLGRVSTAEEIEFLKHPGSSF
ncbi:MAG: DUF924 family protein [Thermodesulfobacteriota bacterium]